MNTESMQPTNDERLLAAFAHASVLANMFNLAGMIATTLVWATQRERSAFVRSHALQALAYQALALLATLTLLIFWGMCVLVSLLPVAVRPDLYRESPPNSFWIALLGLALPLGFSVLTVVYGLYGAYRVYTGRPFRYPLASRVAPAPPAPAASPPEDAG